MTAPFLYMVKFWVSPQGEEDLLRWLDSKHMAEVTTQPGFQWSQRVRLEQEAADGWHAYMMIYGLDSRESLMRYFESDAPKQYAVERKPFEQHLRMERNWGTLAFSVG